MTTLDIIVPKAGLTMTEATIAAWHVEAGQRVKKGQVILELATDKIVIEVEAPANGTIRAILKQPGEQVLVGETVAVLDADDAHAARKDDGMPAGAGPAAAPEKAEAGSAAIFDADVVVIGGGPGGYVAAIRAAQLGARVVLAERDHLGGTCLNRGCIPTKILLHAAQAIQAARKAEAFGVKFGPAKIDFAQLNRYREQAVEQLQRGVAHLLKKNGVRVVGGTARIAGPSGERSDAAEPWMVVVAKPGGETETIRTRNVILAAGAMPRLPAIPGLAEAEPASSADLLNIRPIPRLVIIGGGAVGVEFAFLYALFGSKVTLLESECRILPAMDGEISAALTKALRNAGVVVRTGVRIEQAAREKASKVLICGSGDQTERIEADEILAAAGQQADDGAFRDLGLAVDGRGWVKVDARMRTSQPGIYAVGDMTGMVNLAHAASAQGIEAAENCMGVGGEMDASAVPKCIYISPEAASVGLTEEEAKARGLEVDIGRFPFASLGKALTDGDTEGFVKVLVGRKYREILGVHIVGPHASELIAEAAAAMKLEATAEDWLDAIRPHPSRAEATAEALLAAFGRPLHG